MSEPFVLTFSKRKHIQDSTLESGRYYRPCLRDDSRNVLFISLREYVNPYEAHWQARRDYYTTCHYTKEETHGTEA